MSEKENKQKKRPTAQKRDIQNVKKALRNHSFKSKMRTVVNKYVKFLAKNKDEAKKTLQSIYSLLDKGVKRGIYKKNKANRQKSRLSSRLK